MRVFAVSGFSGTGKTTLIESIIKEINSQGYQVITIKSSRHQPKEEEGTDTRRHQVAGATKSFFKGPSDREKSLKEVVGSHTADFLIVEGMKTSSLPKFWCIGKSELEDTIPLGVKAIISWNSDTVEDKFDAPILNSGDIEQMVTIILAEAIDFERVEV